MKRILFIVLIASTTFAVRTFFVVDAAFKPIVATVEPQAMPIQAEIPTPVAAKPTLTETAATPAPATPLSFEALNRLNDSIDPDKAGFQPYYIQSFMLAGTGSYFAATNLSADTLTSGSATIGSLTIEDGGTVEGTLNTSDLRAEKISAEAGLTLFDQVTGEPHCLTISSGTVSAATGACEG